MRPRRHRRIPHKTTLKALQAFTTAVGTGSITATAEQLGATVSCISRALGRLERKLETTLLRCTTRRIAITDEGTAFLGHARAILAAVDQAKEQMAARRHQPAGRLRVNAAPPVMRYAIVPLLLAFHRKYPRICLELDTDDLNIDLLERRTDIATRIGALQDSTLYARPLASSLIRKASPSCASPMTLHCQRQQCRSGSRELPRSDAVEFGTALEDWYAMPTRSRALARRSDWAGRSPGTNGHA